MKGADPLQTGRSFVSGGITFSGLNTPNCTAGKGFRKDGDASANEKNNGVPFWVSTASSF
jgi:hypothetical protein